MTVFNIMQHPFLSLLLSFLSAVFIFMFCTHVLHFDRQKVFTGVIVYFSLILAARYIYRDMYYIR